MRTVGTLKAPPRSPSILPTSAPSLSLSISLMTANYLLKGDQEDAAWHPARPILRSVVRRSGRSVISRSSPARPLGPPPRDSRPTRQGRVAGSSPPSVRFYRPGLRLPPLAHGGVVERDVVVAELVQQEQVDGGRDAAAA